MKKYFPVILFVLTFTGFLSGQIIFDLFNLSAGLSSKEKAINVHYQNLFSKINLKTSDNNDLKLSKIKAPIVILNFWASWCKPCLEEFPTIVAMKKKFSNDQVLVIGINADEKNQNIKIKKIVKKYNLNFPIVADKDGKALKDFLISSLPVSIIFKNGKVIEISKVAKDFNSGEVITSFQKILKNSKKNINI